VYPFAEPITEEALYLRAVLGQFAGTRLTLSDGDSANDQQSECDDLQHDHIPRGNIFSGSGELRGQAGALSGAKYTTGRTNGPAMF
jgi:hypothetical protein